MKRPTLAALALLCATSALALETRVFPINGRVSDFPPSDSPPREWTGTITAQFSDDGLFQHVTTVSTNIGSFSSWQTRLSVPGDWAATMFDEIYWPGPVFLYTGSFTPGGITISAYGHTENWSATSPIPEPSAVALMLAGLLFVGFTKQRNEK